MPLISQKGQCLHLRISYNWMMLTLLSVTYFLEQGTRQIYNATLPQIRLDFLQYGVSDVQFGMVGTVFGTVFGIAMLVAGFASDFLGRKQVVVIGTAVFSLGIFLAGLSNGLLSLIVFYGIANAMGQSCITPPCFSLICQHFEKSRCTAMGIFSSCNYIGVVVCSVLAGYIGGLGSGVWRWAFWIFGAFGLAWALGLQGLLRPDTDDSCDVPTGRPTFADAFSAIGRKPTAALLVLAFGMLIYVNLGIYLWAPSYLMRSFEGLTLATAAFHAVFWSSLGSMSGLLITARITDWLSAVRQTARCEMTIVGMALCSLTVLAIAFAPTLTACCFGFFAFGFARGVLECTIHPTMFDVIEPRFRAACAGIAGCWAFLFGSLAPAVLGWLGEKLSLRAGFASLAAFAVLGIALLSAARIKFLRKDMIE